MYGELDFFCCCCFIFTFSTLVSLKDLAVMPLGQTFREVVKIALNLTAASVQERNLEGKEFASDGFFFLKVAHMHTGNI